jgi:S1-C subfamily serine protease
MAAPHGIVFPRMVLTFDGYFAGYSPEGYAMYSMPTKPGSSGSPIMNINNELIGNIFAGYRSMENIGVASPLMAIKVFLKNSIAQAEMKVWARMNKNVDKTDVQMLKMSQELHKKMSEYFHIQSVKNMGDVFSPR